MPIPAAGRNATLRAGICFRGIALWLIFPRSHPLQHRELDHDPQLRLLRRPPRSSFSSPATRRHSCTAGRCANAAWWWRAARILKRALAGLWSPTSFLFAILHGGNLLCRRPAFENPLYGEEMGIFDFLPSARTSRWCRRPALEIQSRPTWTWAAALHRAARGVSADAVGVAAGRPAPRSRGLSLLLYVPDLGISDGTCRAYPNGYWVFNPFALAAALRVQARWWRARWCENASRP